MREFIDIWLEKWHKSLVYQHFSGGSNGAILFDYSAKIWESGDLHLIDEVIK